MLNPIHLRTLQAVLRTGSFSRAAVELDYTTPAVSQHIAALERRLDLTLFERRHGTIRPTDAARRVSRTAGQVLTLLEELERESEALAAGRRGEVRLGVFPSAARRLMPTALASLATSHREVTVFFEQDVLLPLRARVQEGTLDLAVVYENDLGTPPMEEDLLVVPLLVEHRHLIVPIGHRLAPRPGRGAGALASPVDLCRFAGERWIATHHSPVFERLCADHGFAPTVTMRTDDFDVMVAMVGAGLGVALVPDLGLHGAAGVVEVPVTQPLPTRRVVAIQRRSCPNPLVPEVLAAIRDSITTFRRSRRTPVRRPRRPRAHPARVVAESLPGAG